MRDRATSKRTAKQERIAFDDAWIEEWNQNLARCDSYGRAWALLDARPCWGRPGVVWFRLLGNWWSVCDGAAGIRDKFARILHRASRKQLDAMMTDEERRRLAEMPDIIRAFRGCEAEDREGFSFSLCEQMARKFPFLNRYKAKVPALIVADIPKERAVLKMDRNEEEIIACGAFSIVTIEIIEGENSPPDGFLRQNPPSVSSTMPG
jgi:hypothetical protein